jgi:signal transduction histidine kinase
MRYWLRGKAGGLLVFLLIALLVIGGLGWVTAAALRLEEEHLEEQAQVELQGQLQLALSLLDSRVRPLLAREDSRPYNHYSAIYAPSVAFTNDGAACPSGTMLEPSPLLNADLPEWMLLHFQADEETGWGSPQVLSLALRARFQNANLESLLKNATDERARLLRELACQLVPKELMAAAREHRAEPSTNLRDTAVVPAPPQPQPNNNEPAGSYTSFANPANPVTPPNYSLGQMGGQGGMNNMPAQQLADSISRKRAVQESKLKQESQAVSQKEDPDAAQINTSRNGADWLFRNSVDNAKKAARNNVQVDVKLSPMVPLWLTAADGQERLVLARVVQVGDRPVCQGILLDGATLRQVLLSEVNDLFPGAQLVPVRDELPATERAAPRMTALPLQLDPGPAALRTPTAGWTPLRVGLTLAWSAALVALSAVGLGGWSLLDLSERRIGFVSAVTHELRTPLTTLRLYLDMLTGGLVKEEQQRREYLHTLRAEAERLNRLVGNVLDYSRLENRRPRLARTTVRVADLLEQVRDTWQGRCQDAGKELVVESAVDGGALLYTDVELVQQVLCNLLDNACKYSRGSADGHVWLRARREGGAQVVLEVEDRGPGVPARERRAIFRPFRRGRSAEVTAGGVGLGLALARRWASVLGGSLCLRSVAEGTGACFQFALPLVAGATGRAEGGEAGGSGVGEKG